MASTEGCSSTRDAATQTEEAEGTATRKPGGECGRESGSEDTPDCEPPEEDSHDTAEDTYYVSVYQICEENNIPYEGSGYDSEC